MKIINIVHAKHTFHAWETDTMYLAGTKSVIKIYQFFSGIDFYTGGVGYNQYCTPLYGFIRK